MSCGGGVGSRTLSCALISCSRMVLFQAFGNDLNQLFCSVSLTSTAIIFIGLLLLALLALVMPTS